MIKQYIKQNTGVCLSQEAENKLEVYYRFLTEENAKYNLTAITERNEVYIKHFADSILGSIAIPQNATLCDVGSGAGFPSIPIAIARSDVRITIVDSLEKRVNFCKTLCNQIGVSAQFYHDRIEDFSKTNSERFDVAAARAVAPLSVLLEYLAQIVKLGGIVLAYKTDDDELASAQNACRTLGLRFEKAFRFVLPDDSKRCLLVFRKTASTPQKYPRGQNKPRKQPL